METLLVSDLALLFTFNIYFDFFKTANTLKYFQIHLDSYLSHHKGKSIDAGVTANHHTYEETKCGYGEDDAE